MDFNKPSGEENGGCLPYHLPNAIGRTPRSAFTFSRAWGRAASMKERHSAAALGLPGRLTTIYWRLMPQTAREMSAKGVTP